MAESIIKAIDSTSIHRITSGQVVIDLQTAVKELVENSLDAGATSIEVRLKDYGLKSIEVIDNGHGVAPEDYDSLAIKHHTSKLASFEDLGTVLTFGFRGEALSSLCALSSSVTVTTATAAQAPMGTVIDFDRSGKIKDKNGKVARQRGTSVLITGLFVPLPVRRKELEKNAKREYGKALGILQAYALVPCANENRGVRLTVSNHPTKGARSVQIRTDGSPSSRTSVSSIWGPKSLENLVALDLYFEVEPERSSILKKRGISQDGVTIVKVKGLVSKFVPGSGRTSSDRQFFYVNGRPCNPSKVQKAFNDVYRSFNANQVPFVIADFQLPTNACDINVSPDKRTIFIHSENNLIQALKASLEETFSSSRSTFSINGASSRGKDKADGRRSGRESSPVSDHEQSHETDVSDDGAADLQEDEDIDVEDHDTPSSNRNAQVQYGEPSQHAENGVHEKPYRKPLAFDGLKRPRSRSQSSNVDLEQNPEETSPEEPEPEDVEIPSEKDDDLAASVPAPDVSFSTEGDEQTSSQNEISPEVRSDTGSTSQPRVPLFLPSPTSALTFQTSSTSKRGEQAPSPSPRPSDLDGPEEHPRKRQRTGSPTPTPVSLTVTSRPVQMVLGTDGAAWSLKLQAGQGSKDLDTRQARKSKSADTSARDKFRSRLSGFLAPGTQMKPIEVDEEEVGGDGSDHEQHEDVEMEAPTRHEDQDQPEEQSEVDELADDDSAFTNPTTTDKISNARQTIIDQMDELADEAGDTSEPAPPDPELSMERYMPRAEIIRTATTGLTLRLDLERLSLTWSRLRSWDRLEPSPSSTPSSSGHIQPSANVTNADDAEAAERELARAIHKKDFSSMHILGQFNLGFIITRRIISSQEGKRGADDLFIVDQHAADEKYNFETLQQTTKIESQKLFQPRPLELTAADELMAIDNVEILRANGFDIMIDEAAHPGQRERVRLVAQPVSKSTTFDMKDLEELLHLMQDQPTGHMVRCSKARAMFAMRACRKSVMVGKALTTSQMTSVVRHMGTMDQPWNCPHGRPTMRHLVNLHQMDRGNKRDRDVDWSKFSPVE